MTEDEFTKVCGYPPKDDDLDRANCSQAGEIGHFACGICETGKPVFLCLCGNCLDRMRGNWRGKP